MSAHDCKGASFSCVALSMTDAKIPPWRTRPPQRSQPNAGRRSRARPRRRQSNRQQPATRSNATRVLATGVGASVPKAFGSKAGHGMRVWDAKHYAHLALPRSVGPYTTIRATRRASISTLSNVIGCFQQGSQHGPSDGKWGSTIMVSDVDSQLAINAAGNAQSTNIDLDALGPAATLVPSALSVQIMCPTALNTASGIVYAGIMNTQAAIGGRYDTWDDYMRKFVQFQNPRLLAASKLALRGVQINSYPLNMTEVSRFTQFVAQNDDTFTYADSRPQPIGWAPIVIFNPSGADLELLITVEYRVRFDLDHPASASHTHHTCASEQTWDRMIASAVALGNGVVDIADVVANAGVAAGRVAALF